MDVWERRRTVARHEALHAVASKRYNHGVVEVHRRDDLTGLMRSGIDTDSVDFDDRDDLIRVGVEKAVVRILPFLDGAFLDPGQCSTDMANVQKLVDAGIPIDRVITEARALLADSTFQDDVRKIELELVAFRMATGARVDEVLR